MATKMSASAESRISHAGCRCRCSGAPGAAARAARCARDGLMLARSTMCSWHIWPARRVLELAPAFWKQTLQQQDTQQRLAPNVFRTVTLAEHHVNV